MKRLLPAFAGAIVASLFVFAFNVYAVSLPGGTALFETSLQSRISSSDTTMSLVANSLRGSESISGYNCFTIDEGRSDSEYVCGTVSGTSVTSLERGLSLTTGTTTIPALQFAHRVGADVKITDFPLIQRLRNQNNGGETFPNPLVYSSHPTFSSTTQLVDKKYVDDTAFSGAGVIDATASARGVVELSTGAEAAAGSSQGGAGALALPASIATSTWNSATAANSVVVTGVSGKIDNNFISTSTLIANNGVGYTLPSSRGASSTVLSENGSGILSWETTNMRVLAATTTTAALVTASTTIGSATHLKVFFYSAGCSTASSLYIRFNSDSGNNYGYLDKDDRTATVQGNSAQPQIDLMFATTATTSPVMINLDVENISANRKFVTWTGVSNSSGAVIPIRFEGSAVWNGTASQINSIHFGCDFSSKTLNVGTTIGVYGSSY